MHAVLPARQSLDTVAPESLAGPAVPDARLSFRLMEFVADRQPLAGRCFATVADVPLKQRFTISDGLHQDEKCEKRRYRALPVE